MGDARGLLDESGGTIGGEPKGEARREPAACGSRIRGILAFACAALGLLAAPLAGAATLPSSIAALGDSLTRGYGASGAPTDAFAYAWATGTDSGVNSHYRRLLTRTPTISGQSENYAVVGAKMADMYAQAGSAITGQAGYVTIMAGTNDVCTSTVGGMTAVANLTTQLRSTLSRLATALPSTRILVVSIPDWYGVWQRLHLDPAAVNAWSTYPRCPDLLGPSATDADRAAVAQRITELNAAAASVCGEFAACTYDGGAVFNLALGATDLSFDYFHLSASGQARVAAATWQAGPYARPSPLTGFTATGGAQAVSLVWSVPAGVTRVVVTQQVGATPTSPGDGTTVYDGSGASGGTTVTGLTPDQTYGYAAWTYDVDGVQGDPVTAQAVPTSGATSPPTNSSPPVISGTARQGETLSASTGSWTDNPTGYAYQWRRCDSAGGGCTDIAGGSGSAYGLVAADVGSTIRVRVTATNAGGSGTAISAQTVAVTSPPAGAYEATVVDAGCAGCVVLVDAAGVLTATIQGGADSLDTAYGVDDFGGGSGLAGRVYVRTLLGLAAGETLAANLAVFQVRDASGALVYELYLAPDRTLRLWSPTAGLQAGSLNLSSGVVVPNDGSSTIRVEVSALANSSISVRVDDVDRISVSGLYGATTANQRYLRAGIDHYDTQTTNEPVGVSHASVAVSQAGWLGAPASSPPENTAPPTINGTAEQGQTLTASTGSWTGNPSSYAYQWRRCDSAGAGCNDIAGATSPSYLLVAADVGATIRVQVTATNSAGSASAQSAQTATVNPPPPPPANTTPPAISGTPEQGQTLTASTGSWTGTPTSYAYQWRRCDSAGAGCNDIAGATNQTYLLATSDVGATIRVRVTATNGGGSGSADSAPSPVVTAPTQPNLAPDPDFETNPNSWYFTVGDGAFSWATDAARSGSHSLKIVSTTGTLSRWLSNTSQIPAQPGKTYTASAWLKTTNANQANLSINFWNGGSHLGTYTSQTLTGTQPFTQLTVQATAPAATTSIRIEFRLTGPGTLWADDAIVTAS